MQDVRTYISKSDGVHTNYMANYLHMNTMREEALSVMMCGSLKVNLATSLCHVLGKTSSSLATITGMPNCIMAFTKSTPTLGFDQLGVAATAS